MNIRVQLNPAYTTAYTKWEFTGRIKYIKYSFRVDMELEIEYTETYMGDIDKGQFLLSVFTFGLYQPKQLKRKYKTWVSEKGFYLSELPETVIIECN